MEKLFFAFLLLMPTCIQTSLTLPSQRTKNLIILNDTSETPLHTFNSFFWNQQGHLTMTYELVQALYESENPILTTKSLWSSMQWHAQVWYDFTTLDQEEIIYKYQKFITESKEDFQKHIQKYQPVIKIINELYEASNNLISLQKTQWPSSIARQLEQYYSIAAVQRNPAICQTAHPPLSISCQDLIEIKKEHTVHAFFYLYLYYRNIPWNKLYCHDINEHYILFVPQAWYKKRGNSYSDLFDKETNDAQVETGLRALTTPLYNPKQQVATMPRTMLRSLKQPPLHIAPYLLDALQKTFVLRSDLKKATATQKSNTRLEPWLLPAWNIYLAGHGAPNNTTSGLSILGKNSEFKQVLEFFAHKVRTQFLAYSSCYPAGSKLQPTFGFTSPASSDYLGNLPYVMMALGITKAPTSITQILIDIPPFTSASHIMSFININRGTNEGKFFPIQQYISFKDFFMHIVQKNYEAANHAVGYLLDGEQKLKKEYAHNIAMIKAPGTQWLRPLSFNKEVMPLYQINAASKTSPIQIKPRTGKSEPETKALLLFANYINRKIIVNRAMPLFIPMSLFSQNYYFENIQASYHTLTNFIQTCFSVHGSQEEFTYYIKKLTTSKPNTTYSIILKNKNIAGKMQPIILYIQDIQGEKTIKQYIIEITNKVNFTPVTPPTAAEVERQIAEGKSLTETYIPKSIEKLRNIFAPGKTKPEKVQQSHEKAQAADKDLRATQSLLQLNEILEIIR